MKFTEECSAILHKKLPQKLKDPRSFKIPCTIREFKFKALCDLGASVNLMPLSIFRQLGLRECKPTTISLQLADMTIKYPRGVIQDILVKVEKFLLLAYFIVLDMEEDKDIPIIVGQPLEQSPRPLLNQRMREEVGRSKERLLKELSPVGPS